MMITGKFVAKKLGTAGVEVDIGGDSRDVFFALGCGINQFAKMLNTTPEELLKRLAIFCEDESKAPKAVVDLTAFSNEKKE